MHIGAIPRGSLAARLVAADMLVRLQELPRQSIAIQEAVTAIGNYMVDPKVCLSDSDLTKYQSLIDHIYQ